MCLCTQSHDCQLIKSRDKPRHKEGGDTAPSETIPGNCSTGNKMTAEWVEFIQGLEGETLAEELEGEVKIEAQIDYCIQWSFVRVNPLTQLSTFHYCHGCSLMTSDLNNLSIKGKVASAKVCFVGCSFVLQS